LIIITVIVAGYILTVIGCIASFVGELKMLAISYRRGFGWLLFCLLLAPVCWLLLLLVDFKATARPFALAVFGLIAAGIGAYMAGIDID